MFARSYNRYAVLTHQTSDTTVTDIQADLFQFFGHAWPAITAQTETGLLLPSRDIAAQCPAGQWMWASVTKSDRCLRLARRLRNARKPRELTFITLQRRAVSKVPACSSMNLNLMAFGPRRTGRRENSPPDCFLILGTPGVVRLGQAMFDPVDLADHVEPHLP